MQEGAFTMVSDQPYPVLLIPKKCTSLETHCDVTDNVFLDLKVTSMDTEDNVMTIYSGFCNVKVLDSYNLVADDSTISLENPPDMFEEATLSTDAYDEQWMNLASPNGYNNFDVMESQESYSVYQESHSNHIRVEQVKASSTYITKNVFNRPISYSPEPTFQHKKFRKSTSREREENQQADYDSDDRRGGCSYTSSDEISKESPKVFLNISEQEQGENSALKQLMSSDIQTSRQQKTILYLGKNSQCGQTVQNIAINDSFLECIDNDTDIKENSGITSFSDKKKYRCDNCKQYFDQIQAFRRHMVINHRPNTSSIGDSDENVSLKYTCNKCNKNYKSRVKYEQHCIGHGHPELECTKCHKVFASKYTLRNHSKIHERKHRCLFCIRSYEDATALNKHMNRMHSRKHACLYCPKKYKNEIALIKHVDRMHFKFICNICNFGCRRYEEFCVHLEEHQIKNCESDEMSFDCESVSSDTMMDTNFELSEVSVASDAVDPVEPADPTDATDPADVAQPADAADPADGADPADPAEEAEAADPAEEAEAAKADSVIAKVMSNKMFLMRLKRGKKRRTRKVCGVCKKTFDRLSDLKRHLIEHVIRSTLAKNPVNKNGTLTITCDVCRTETFARIDKYKAHLREHAKLTLYKCMFCDKSFSDSSNFSKHKKIHGSTYFQCDLCQRKFNSKKTLSLHMEHHNKNPPVFCKYCDKKFYFESMLNKHIKSLHSKEMSRVRCRFCRKHFKSLKEKWDHEWNTHNVRKTIVDCLVCDLKFRKYSELRRHCHDMHRLDIPLAKVMLGQS